MTISMLHPGPAEHPQAQAADRRGEPSIRALHDLNIDQVVDAVSAKDDSGTLARWYRQPLIDVDHVAFRQEVFRDLQDQRLRDVVSTFTESLIKARRLRTAASQAHYRHLKRRWTLDAVTLYCDTVEETATGLSEAEPSSRGLIELVGHLRALAASHDFRQAQRQARDLLVDLSAVRYNVLIHGQKITVAHFDDERDYGQEVVDVFDRFRQTAVGDRAADQPDERAGSTEARQDLGHVEAAIIDRVARLEPELFGRLDGYCDTHAQALDPEVDRVAGELQFYLAWLRFLEPLHAAGLFTCLPTVSATNKAEQAHAIFDLALAASLSARGTPVVVNDLELSGTERTLVVSGPNQGGKTTLARTFGQLHYFAALGCPVPGRDARLFLCDRILTHFDRQEQMDALSGRLESELVRIREVLDCATSSSVLVLNEIFSSTSVNDAVFLGRQVLHRVSELDALCVCVTFLDELSVLNATTVSMVSTVDPADPAVRTFHVVRRRADGKAFARALADKYHLGYDDLVRRIAS